MNNSFGLTTNLNFLNTYSSVKSSGLPILSPRKTHFSTRKQTLDQVKQSESTSWRATFREKRMSSEERKMLPADLKPATLEKQRHNQDQQEMFATASTQPIGNPLNPTSIIFDLRDKERFRQVILRAQPPNTISTYKLKLDRKKMSRTYI
jgi:hypothetical protein